MAHFTYTLPPMILLACRFLITAGRQNTDSHVGHTHRDVVESFVILCRKHLTSDPPPDFWYVYSIVLQPEQNTLMDFDLPITARSVGGAPLSLMKFVFTFENAMAARPDSAVLAPPSRHVLPGFPVAAPLATMLSKFESFVKKSPYQAGAACVALGVGAWYLYRLKKQADIRRMVASWVRLAARAPGPHVGHEVTCVSCAPCAWSLLMHSLVCADGRSHARGTPRDCFHLSLGTAGS